jgi:hypothetical protein
MTLDELKSLREGEVVVFTKVDERITDYHNHQVGDEMTFLEIQDADGADVVNFLRTPPNTYVISHFSYEICHYIESKIKLERDKKLNSIGI